MKICIEKKESVQSDQGICCLLADLTLWNVSMESKCPDETAYASGESESEHFEYV